ncbi:MAG: hypothetical protein IKE14_06410 [Loktanella sp.]|nr:hypothetical protein [Loktanella sp.]
MSETGGATQKLGAALDRLKACRASDKDYVAASQDVLAEMAKLGPIGPNTPVELANLYKKLTQEFLYAEKCAELRRPAYVGNTGSQTSKY